MEAEARTALATGTSGVLPALQAASAAAINDQAVSGRKGAVAVPAGAAPEAVHLPTILNSPIMSLDLNTLHA